MATHLILSIGTSIIGNYNKLAPDDQKIIVDYPPGWSYQKVYDDVTFPAPELQPPLKYQILASILKEEKYQGAEESTFVKLKASEQFPDDVDCQYHLIATDTAEGIFCAYFLGHAIFPSSKVNYYIPQGLGTADNKRFASRGLPSLLSCIADILDKVEQQPEDEAIIIPTGGYKILTPYLTIASILYKQPAYYLYEASQSAIELPAPPLSVNTTEFRSAVVLLENIIGLKRHKAVTYYKAIPKSFQTLVYTDEHGEFQYTAFGQRLKKMFNRASRSPLVIRASENTLIQRLGTYQERFKEMTRLGDTVWLGDKAPEMADHARHHHLDLFAYAELLLLPIFTDQPEFLSPTELFLLLGMIYLHDCGHSMAAFPTTTETVPLLPTEIRNFHNLLGFLRLKDAVFYQALQRQRLHLDKTTLENIATLSVYHRKKMPLLEGTYPSPDGATFYPLAEQSLNQGDHTLPGDRLALLVALFRMIDGMDKQLERAGDAVEISMKAEAILADLPYLWHRVLRLKDAMASLSSEAKSTADVLLHNIIADYGPAETVTGQPGKKPRESFHYLDLRQSLNQPKQLPLVWEYLEACVRFFFQALQPSFYYSDLLLKMPRVTHSINPTDGLRTVTITYTVNEDQTSAAQLVTIWQDILKWIEEHVASDEPERNILKAKLPTPIEVVEGIRKEYNPEVKKILGQNNITFNILLENV